MSIAVVAIFDIGKTNKKLVLFDECYQVVFDQSVQIPEINDEDDFACEDIHALTTWIITSLKSILKNKEFEVKAVNFSAYGASLIYLDNTFNVFLPLYNYLKPCYVEIQEQFYKKYGGKKLLCKETASPALGNLNSGFQLFGLKHQKPELFQRIKYAVHLPQYCSYILSSKIYSDITGIGCHTHLWNFQKNSYHAWVNEENILEKLPVIQTSDTTTLVSFEGKDLKAGIGMHDSSAALIPYMINKDEPFVLISTGTWCISLNPFNDAPLSDFELANDCLCYLNYDGKEVKASRLFAGGAYNEQVKRMSKFFHESDDYYTSMKFNPAVVKRLKAKQGQFLPFAEKSLSEFNNGEEAYHQLMIDITVQQHKSTQMIVGNKKVRKIYVDGGFSKNEIYMKLLGMQFPDMEIFAASMSYGSALGAALAIHRSWNSNSIPDNLIAFKKFSSVSIF